MGWQYERNRQPSTLGKCPTCSGDIALSATQCPHCGEKGFEELGEVVEKTTCSRCGGDGKARSDGVEDYCSYCSGRGFTLTYQVLDKRTNQPVGLQDDTGGHTGSFRTLVEPVHRGRAVGCLSQVFLLAFLWCYWMFA